MKINSLTSVVLIVAQITVCYFMLESFVVVSAGKGSKLMHGSVSDVSV